MLQPGPDAIEEQPPAPRRTSLLKVLPIFLGAFIVPFVIVASLTVYFTKRAERNVWIVQHQGVCEAVYLGAFEVDYEKEQVYCWQTGLEGDKRQLVFMSVFDIPKVTYDDK